MHTQINMRGIHNPNYKKQNSWFFFPKILNFVGRYVNEKWNWWWFSWIRQNIFWLPRENHTHLSFVTIHTCLLSKTALKDSRSALSWSWKIPLTFAFPIASASARLSSSDRGFDFKLYPDPGPITKDGMFIFLAAPIEKPASPPYPQK